MKIIFITSGPELDLCGFFQEHNSNNIERIVIKLHILIENNTITLPCTLFELSPFDF